MKLKQLREMNHLSQKDVAKILNVTQGAYSLYEQEERKITVDNLIKLSNFYGVSLDYICDHPYNNQIGYIPDDKKDLVKDILDLSEAETKEIHQYVKGYKSAKNVNK